MNWLRTFFVLLTASILAGCASRDLPRDPALAAERKGIAFLTQEVPAWHKDNGCFSCHNNGDAARALYLATTKGYRFPAAALATTTDWVTHPQRWDANKGDPGFSDKNLADVQFAASLLAAINTGHARNRDALPNAVARLLRDQVPDGSWPIGAHGTLGSPATHGTSLATYMALQTMRHDSSPAAIASAKRAEQWLHEMTPNNVLNAATILLTLKDVTGSAIEVKRQLCLQFIRRAQSSEGAWGPYADAPPEVFDTAMVLLALSPWRDQPEVTTMIQCGRKYLVTMQNEDGSWPETTRPSGGNSYAQRLSTTGWAVQALLQTRD